MLWLGLALGCGAGVAGGPEPHESWLSARGEDVQPLAWAAPDVRGGAAFRVALWHGHLDGGRSAFSVARAGRGFGPVRAARLELRSRRGVLEVPDSAGQRLRCAAEGGARRQWLVQFWTSVQPEYLARLRQLDAEVLRAFPSQGLVVRAGAGGCAALLEEPFVRAVLPVEVSDKVEPLVLAGEGARVALVLSASAAPDERGLLAARCSAAGIELDGRTLTHLLVRVRGTPAQLLALAAWPEVLFVDRWAAPEHDVDKARRVSGADFAEETLGLAGQGVRGEVMDGNLLASHPDLSSRSILFHGQHEGDESHGTSTTGLVFGDGSGRAAARGLLPGGQPIFAGNAPVAYGRVSRFEHTQELVRAPYEAVFQSNSWGSGLTTEYTALSAELDQIVFDTDLLVFQSMSNMGSRLARPQAWSKNVVAVGGVNHRDTVDPADDAWAYGASVGPAADGRIKPDLAHFWDRTLAPSSDGAYTEDFGGTSGATPITAGLAGLFFQAWSQGLFGNVVKGRTVFEARPHFSTAKAMLINTASQWSFESAASDLGRCHQGWGRVDLRRMIDLRDRMLVVDETELLGDGDVARYPLQVDPGTPELRATLTWADPPALPSAGVHRVNELDLVVRSPSGLVYFGNAGLRDGVRSVAGGEPDGADTVENVIVERPEAGAWQVEVRAVDVAQDGHVETSAVDVDFALVVSGVRLARTVPAPPLVAITAPSPGEALRGAFELRAEVVPGLRRVARVRFGLPDGSWVDDDEAPYAVQLDAGRHGPGAAQLTALAFDQGGATSNLAVVDVQLLPGTDGTGVDPQAPPL